MRCRELQIDFINQSCAEFRGFGVRELYTRDHGRPPVYNTRTKSWVTTPARAADLGAQAEARGWLVTYAGALEHRQAGLPVGPAVEPSEDQQPDLREVGLW